MANMISGVASRRFKMPMCVSMAQISGIIGRVTALGSEHSCNYEFNFPEGFAEGECLRTSDQWADVAASLYAGRDPYLDSLVSPALYIINNKNRI